jgi:hypothetical protein
MDTPSESSFLGILSQEEIDEIAAYVQAVNDLSVTPLFEEGQPAPQNRESHRELW